MCNSDNFRQLLFPRDITFYLVVSLSIFCDLIRRAVFVASYVCVGDVIDCVSQPNIVMAQAQQLGAESLTYLVVNFS